MKFRICLFDHHNRVRDLAQALEGELDRMAERGEIEDSNAGKGLAEDEVKDKLKATIKPWFLDGCGLCVEFDTEDGAATVIPREEAT